MNAEVTSEIKRVAWSLADISTATGLSLPFLRNEVRSDRLPVRRFGRRLLVLDEDFKSYLSRGSSGELHM